MAVFFIFFQAFCVSLSVVSIFLVFSKSRCVFCFEFDKWGMTSLMSISCRATSPFQTSQSDWGFFRLVQNLAQLGNWLDKNNTSRFSFSFANRTLNLRPTNQNWGFYCLAQNLAQLGKWLGKYKTYRFSFSFTNGTSNLGQSWREIQTAHYALK